MCEYNWRVYDGTTPADAVEGGKDANGVTFYIALVHLKLVNEKLAGMIIPSTQTAYISSFAIAQNVRNDAFTEVKILCSADRDAFEWIPTTSENLHLLTKHHLVPGGMVLGQSMYIGRVRHDGGVVVGKVFPHSFIFQGLWIPSNGTHFQYLSYEVLAFNPKKKEGEEIQSGVDADVDDIFSDVIDVRGNFSEGPVCREGSNNGVRSASDQEEARSRGVSLSSQNDTDSSLPSCSGHKELSDGNNDN